MPSDPSSSSRSSSSRSRSGGSGSSRGQSTSDRAKDVQKKATEAGGQVKEAAAKAGEVVSSAVSGAADALGGWRELDKYVKDYNPTLHDFVNKSFLKKFEASNKPSKFLVCLLGLGIIQSTIPLFAWPLDFLARILSFVFLFNSGTEELKAGFGNSDSRAFKVKSLMTAYILLSVFELVPAFAFDTTFHFGALWNFMLPMLMFVTPDRKKPKETIAVWAADSIFSQVSSVIGSVVPEAFDGADQSTTFIAAGVLGLLLWTGFIGATGSYVSVYIFLFVQSVNHLGKDYVCPTDSSSGFTKQMTVWHNLLAIWLWRYLVSAIENLHIPGVISVLGWILYHVPSYFLWMTGFFFLMLFTKKTASGEKANTWYANWLAGRIGGKKKSSSSSESGSGSGSGSSSSRPSGSSSTSSSSRLRGSGGSSSSSSKPKK